MKSVFEPGMSSLPDLGISSSAVSTFMQEVYMCLACIDRLLLPPHENVPRSWPSALNTQNVSTNCTTDAGIRLRDLGKFETVFGGLTAAIARPTLSVKSRLRPVENSKPRC
jgi:hypothetical protein